MLGDDVDDALARFAQVAQTVFGVVEAACVADDEDRGVMVDDLGVGEGGQVCAAAYECVNGLLEHTKRMKRETARTHHLWSVWTRNPRVSG